MFWKCPFWCISFLEYIHSALSKVFCDCQMTAPHSPNNFCKCWIDNMETVDSIHYDFNSLYHLTVTHEITNKYHPMAIFHLNWFFFFFNLFLKFSLRDPKGIYLLSKVPVCAVLSHSVMSDCCNPMESSPPGSFVHGDSPGKNTGVGCHALRQGDLRKPGIECRSPTLQVDSLLSEPPGKPQNTALGSLPLFQGNFLTQESNYGLLHCRQILYQLSYPGSPTKCLPVA